MVFESASTTLGAKAFIQACEAYKKKIDIHKFAKLKENKELARAIEFFEGNRTAIQKISQTS